MRGETFAELTQSFRDSVDEYLEFCESLGRSPEKPLSGSPYLRLAAGEYRVIYRDDEDVVHIVLVGKRNDSEVYRTLQRMQ